eukprot:Hpha_TRINITY_DN8924_c0_g1::TRINITY_DN8924_c0_g1_i1::g.80797::m.80797
MLCSLRHAMHWARMLRRPQLRCVSAGVSGVKSELPCGKVVRKGVPREVCFVKRSKGLDDHADAVTTLTGKVVKATREGPKATSKCSEYYVDWYTIHTECGERLLRHVVFGDRGPEAVVGETIECKVKQDAKGHASLHHFVRPELEELRGEVVGVEKKGPRLGVGSYGNPGEPFVIYNYNVRTPTGSSRSFMEFAALESPSMFKMGEMVSVFVHNGSSGFTKLLRSTHCSS